MLHLFPLFMLILII